jgi:hypothetical protein
MYNPVIADMVAREALRRIEADLPTYQAMNQAERKQRISSPGKPAGRGLFQLVQRFFRGKKPASPMISDCE